MPLVLYNSDRSSRRLMPKRSAKSSVPYQSDPDFRRWTASAPMSGPGQNLTPQEREVVRRLVLAAGNQPAVPLESLESYLPKGVRLSPDQWALLRGLISAPGRQNSQAMQALWRQDYRRTPPSLEVFLDEEEYLGTALRRTDANEGMWPRWREWLIEHAGLESFLHNLVLSGAIGIGKTLVMVTLLLYRIALCACLRDPYLFYGLAVAVRSTFYCSLFPKIPSAAPPGFTPSG